MMTKTVLVIDQNQNRLKRILEYWRHEPWHTITANSLQEGIDVLDDTAIDMVIVMELQDWLSGTEFLELTHHRYPQMIRILVTDETTIPENDEDDVPSFHAEADIHYRSPYQYDTEQMTKIIHAMFGSEEALQHVDVLETASHCR